MALILGFDTETTGVNPKTDFILEAGAAIYDTEERQFVRFSNNLIKWPERPVIDPEVKDIHGIDQKMIDRWGKSPKEVFEEISEMADQCDYMCGHNVMIFDKPIYETALMRVEDPAKRLLQKFYTRKWIDTICDIPYPKNIKTRKLEYVALHHKYVHQQAHRALFDVFAAVHILSCYDFDLVREIAATPLIIVQAEDLPFARKHEASSAGFYWQPDPIKKWQKSIRAYFLDNLKNQLSFDVSILQEKLPEITNGAALIQSGHQNNSTPQMSLC